MRGWLTVIVAAVAVGCGSDRASEEDREQAILDLEGDPESGRVVYEADCVVCHAESGLGVDDPTSPGIGMDLTEASGEVEEDPEFVDIILHGKEEMTPFEDILSDQEIADVIAYIHDGLFQ